MAFRVRHAPEAVAESAQSTRLLCSSVFGLRSSVLGSGLARSYEFEVPAS